MVDICKKVKDTVIKIKGYSHKDQRKHKLRQPGGSWIAGCTHFVYEYDPDEKDDEKCVIPCVSFYPAKGIGEGKLKKYVRGASFREPAGLKLVHILLSVFDFKRKTDEYKNVWIGLITRRSWEYEK